MPGGGPLVRADSGPADESLGFEHPERDADGARASRPDHAIEDSDPDGGLGLLTGQLAGMQVVAEDALRTYSGRQTNSQTVMAQTMWSMAS